MFDHLLGFNKVLKLQKIVGDVIDWLKIAETPQACLQISLLELNFSSNKETLNS
jgi:hypothetical protein